MTDENLHLGLLQQVEENLQQSLLLDDNEKAFWLFDLKNLPIHTLENILAELKKNNDLVDEYVKMALVNDVKHEYLQGLKAEIHSMKNKAFQIESAVETEDAEKILEDALDKNNS